MDDDNEVKTGINSMFDFQEMNLFKLFVHMKINVKLEIYCIKSQLSENVSWIHAQGEGLKVRTMVVLLQVTGLQLDLCC